MCASIRVSRAALGGLAPNLIVAQDGKGDYGFLDLGQTPFDLTDRGVKGRVTPSALDAEVFTERGVYRAGETVYTTMLLRDAQRRRRDRPALDLCRQAAGWRRI